MTGIACVLLDVDGTLLDSNAAHAHAWFEVLRRHGHPVALDAVRACIGKGSDKLLPELIGLSADSDEARQLGEERKELFHRALPTLHPTRGARALIEHLQQLGLKLVVATSSEAEELGGLLRQAGVEDLLPVVTTSDDATSSKPDPDIVGAALKKAGMRPEQAVMIGDTPFDVAAARQAGVQAIALRCGGYWDDKALSEAVEIYDDPAQLLARLPSSVLG